MTRRRFHLLAPLQFLSLSAIAACAAQIHIGHSGSGPRETGSLPVSAVHPAAERSDSAEPRLVFDPAHPEVPGWPPQLDGSVVRSVSRFRYEGQIEREGCWAASLAMAIDHIARTPDSNGFSRQIRLLHQFKTRPLGSKNLRRPPAPTTPDEVAGLAATQTIDAFAMNISPSEYTLEAAFTVANARIANDHPVIAIHRSDDDSPAHAVVLLASCSIADQKPYALIIADPSRGDRFLLLTGSSLDEFFGNVAGFIMFYPKSEKNAPAASLTPPPPPHQSPDASR